MARPPLEVADIIRALGDSLSGFAGLVISVAQKRVMHALVACRTARLGGHVEHCDHCEHERIAYNSCRNRHCPKCQAARRARWFEDRRRDLLPAEYFHVVFTVPAEVAAIALPNKRVVYGILFRAASETLLEIAADPRHLGARIGFVAVLHTWSQTLLHHPHVHCIVPGGGLSPGRERWISSRPGFFLPVKVLGSLYRGKFLAHLAEAHRSGELHLTGTLEKLLDPGQFAALLMELRRKPWVVYAKPPAAGPECVLAYLARYTHRVAIANSRLVSFEDGVVRFRYKDYAAGAKSRVMQLDAVEFVRRFLLHVLPRSFVRIRHYGLLANAVRRENVALCRSLMPAEAAAQQPDIPTDRETADATASNESCPKCNVGTMVRTQTFRPGALLARNVPEPVDSS